MYDCQNGSSARSEKNQKFVDETAEFPNEFVNVTETDPDGRVLVLTVNGTVKLKELPYCVDCEPLYQLAKAPLTSSTTGAELTLVPVKEKVALVSSLDVDKPST